MTRHFQIAEPARHALTAAIIAGTTLVSLAWAGPFDLTFGYHIKLNDTQGLYWSPGHASSELPEKTAVTRLGPSGMPARSASIEDFPISSLGDVDEVFPKPDEHERIGAIDRVAWNESCVATFHADGETAADNEATTAALGDGRWYVVDGATHVADGPLAGDVLRTRLGDCDLAPEGPWLTFVTTYKRSLRTYPEQPEMEVHLESLESDVVFIGFVALVAAGLITAVSIPVVTLICRRYGREARIDLVGFCMWISLSILAVVGYLLNGRYFWF